jgi:hypothetical protein
MARLMKARDIMHPTSECTLRGFTCPGQGGSESRILGGDLRRAE